MKILLATGIHEFENRLRSQFTNITFEDRNVLFREGVDDVIKNKKSDIVILSERLHGNTLSQEDLVKQIRKRHPLTRIIYILDDKENIHMRRFLYSLGVYDVFSIKPKLILAELYNSFFKANEWKDVYQFYGDLDEREKYLIQEEEYLSHGEDEEETTYVPFQPHKTNDLSSALMRVVSFWSVRDQSGKTFLAVNTALMLAQNNEQKILVVDFNIPNPSVHVQFKFEDADGNHNLGALIEDIEKNYPIDAQAFVEYLVVHNTYRNLHILPGYILKVPPPSSESVIRCFDNILKFAYENGYTAVIIDCGSGLYDESTLHILSKSQKIITAISESPCSIFALNRCFDREVGPFYNHLLDLNKIVPVLNHSPMNLKTPKTKSLVQAILEVPVRVTFPYSEEIRDSILEGRPLLRVKPDDHLYYNFIHLANHIQKVFEAPTDPLADPLDIEEKETKNRFPSLFRKPKKHR